MHAQAVEVALLARDLASKRSGAFFRGTEPTTTDANIVAGRHLLVSAREERPQRNLAALQDRQEEIEALERGKDALLESYARMAPEALDALAPEDRRQVYKMLKIKVTAYPDAQLEVGGILTSAARVCSGETPRG